VHWARLEASELGSLNAACPAWKKERKKKEAPNCTSSHRDVYCVTTQDGTRKQHKTMVITDTVGTSSNNFSKSSSVMAPVLKS